MPVQGTQSSPNPVAAAQIEQWLGLQPVIDEVAREILTREGDDVAVPKWFLDAIPDDGVRRGRDELVAIAAAAIQRIVQIDAAGG